MKDLIHKYLFDTISDAETKKLKDWLKHPKNKERFETYIRESHALNMLYNNVNADEALNKVWAKIETETKVIPFYRRTIFRYVAAILIFLSAGYFFLINTNSVEDETPIIVDNIKAGTDKATLTLEDGSEVTLEKGEQYISGNLESNGEKLVYTATNTAEPEIKFNYLTIPRGGQYHITLSDGTEVWLNSESKLKYPTSFANGEERKVELIYGEAYFDVSSSTNHDGSKFKVLTGIQELEVLGTEFNVKAYKDESHIYTTLVEGQVKFHLEGQEGNAVFLEPGMQGVVSIEDRETEVNKVDTYLYTAWKDGRFVFRNEKLSNIMAMIEKWYDIEVSYSDPEAKQISFSLDIRKYESFNKIKQILELTGTIDFKVDGRVITVQQNTK
ncbi:FecR domain-containing protein [Tamlana sp. 2201CG12-4]|uniref:FecR family protein n=1 Tax=Tamlana sp. 2201CG12-4 TaxID=3112582 RepID=UPI002DB966B0|nr:FecR domain-containing protein [Tamlana sp. 2201CG12-4]MEC3906752.1 FecR domain-containing protein [Tamlana sp. 2201CG12-4]